MTGSGSPTSQDVRHRWLRKLTTAIVAVILLITGVNMWLLTANEPPPESVSETQYQSLLLSISAASYYSNTGIQLVIDRPPSEPARFEDLAVDDVGYAIGLGLATRFDAVEFSEETRSFVSGIWELEDSRTFMYDTVRHEMDHLNRVLFAGVATLISVALLAFAWNAVDHLPFWCNAVGLALILFGTGQVAPHLVPRLFVFRLHVHGVIASLALLGMASVLSLRASMSSPSILQSASTAEKVARVSMAFLAGLTLSTVMVLRRAEGIIWLVIAVLTAFVLIARAVRSLVDRSALAIGVISLGLAFLVGYVIPGYVVDSAINHRESSVPNLAGELQPPIHPIYHATLIGISRSPRNTLGIGSEADVVALVQTESGFRGNAFSEGYEEASRQVYFDYVTENPINYVSVLYDNMDQTLGFALLNFGLQVQPYGQALLIGVMIIGLLKVVIVMVKRGGGFRFLAYMLSAYLLLGFAIAVATTSAASHGPTIGMILLIISGIAAWLATRIETSLRWRFR